ncbi:MAG: transporter substrate-binding domain-containing protein, partial [Silvanigrellaceae bacterium]|nr:transporter substrate-binding domain-containing protein [Silvanigrellaceae bacterium]
KNLIPFIVFVKCTYWEDTEGFPWERAQMLVKNGEFNSHFTVKTDKREEFLLFQNGNTISTRIAIAYSKNNNLKAEVEKINSIESFKKFELISYIGDNWIDTYFSKDKNFNIVKISNLNSVLAMINSNRKDIHITANDLGIKYIIKKNNLNNVFIKNINFVEASDIEFKFCLLKSYPNSKALMAEIEKNLTIAKNSGIIDKIISKYL